MMATAKKTPATSADLHAKSVAMAAEVTVASAEVARLETELGAALVAGDDVRAKATQEALSVATATAQRLDIGARAFKAATAAAKEAEEAERIAELEREFDDVRDRLHAANLAIGEGILALRPLGATLVEDGKRARTLAQQLGRGGRDTFGPRQAHLEALLRSTMGSLYTGRVDSHASVAIEALRRPWRVPAAKAVDDAATDTEATAD